MNVALMVLAATLVGTALSCVISILPALHAYNVLGAFVMGMFALTARGYEALSRNLAEMARWAKEASYQLDFYRRTRQQPAPAQVDDGKGGK